MERFFFFFTSCNLLLTIIFDVQMFLPITTKKKINSNIKGFAECYTLGCHPLEKLQLARSSTDSGWPLTFPYLQSTWISLGCRKLVGEGCSTGSSSLQCDYSSIFRPLSSPLTLPASPLLPRTTGGRPFTGPFGISHITSMLYIQSS